MYLYIPQNLLSYFHKERIYMKTVCPYTVLLALCISFLLCSVLTPPAEARENATYVGSQKCGECHESEYKTFQKHSKKAKSWHSVAVMSSKLTPEELQGCYACHTTGYNKGGFVDYKKSPHLADVGCESCHGPGAKHAADGDPASIQRKPAPATCQSCHDSKRIRSFKRDPLMYSGAH